MLNDLLNQEVKLTYVLGYTYGTKKGLVTNITPEFITIDNHTMINTNSIVKVEIKETKYL